MFYCSIRRYYKNKWYEIKKTIISSKDGAKIYYDLFYDFILIDNTEVKNYLQNSFPEYFEKFINKELPEEQFTFIDYEKQEIILYNIE